MKKIMMMVLLISCIILVSCGYEPKYSEEFYINYVNNLEENNELYGVENRFKLPLTNNDKKEIDNILNKTFRNSY